MLTNLGGDGLKVKMYVKSITEKADIVTILSDCEIYLQNACICEVEDKMLTINI
jgi:hypothetical protein